MTVPGSLSLTGSDATRDVYVAVAHCQSLSVKRTLRKLGMRTLAACRSCTTGCSAAHADATLARHACASDPRESHK